METNARKVFGVYEDAAEAQRAVDKLLDMGYQSDNISILSRDKDKVEDMDNVDTTLEGEDSSTAAGLKGGVATGATVGGVGGLLAGLGALAIPGIGPILAAGPLVAALSGAVAGGAIGGTIGTLGGALMDAGVSEEDARYVDDRFQEGKIIVYVDANRDRFDDVSQTLNYKNRSSTEPFEGSHNEMQADPDNYSGSQFDRTPDSEDIDIPSYGTVNKEDPLGAQRLDQPPTGDMTTSRQDLYDTENPSNNEFDRSRDPKDMRDPEFETVKDGDTLGGQPIAQNPIRDMAQAKPKAPDYENEDPYNEGDYQEVQDVVKETTDAENDRSYSNLMAGAGRVNPVDPTVATTHTGSESRILDDEQSMDNQDKARYDAEQLDQHEDDYQDKNSYKNKDHNPNKEHSHKDAKEWLDENAEEIKENFDEKKHDSVRSYYDEEGKGNFKQESNQNNKQEFKHKEDHKEPSNDAGSLTDVDYNPEGTNEPTGRRTNSEAKSVNNAQNWSREKVGNEDHPINSDEDQTRNRENE